jgi:hypothetical protein
MLYKFFNSIATRLSSGVSALEGVEWFNDQYNGTILKAPMAFVEFPEPIPVEEVSKDLTRSEMTVRIHVVSKVLTKVDNTVPDQAVIDHEDVVVAVRDQLRGYTLTETILTVIPEDPPEPESILSETLDISNKLNWRRVQHFHKFQGWMVTTLDYVFKSSSFN